MPRIAHVISTPEGIGGAERILSWLLAAGAGAGWDQIVLNPFGLAADGGELERVCRDAAPDIHFETLQCGSIARVPALRRRLREHLDRYQPDVIHAHLFHAMVLCGSLRARVSTPLILTHHHGDHNVAEKRRIRTLLDRRYGARFDVIVAISRYVADLLVNEFGMPPNRVQTIRNGWSGTPLPPVPHERPTVVCVARLREQKGHDDLLHAFAQVHAEVPDALLRLVGDGPLRDRISALVTELGLDGFVQLEGDVDDVWPILAEADVLTLTSRYEPLGIAVMEGVAAGLPVVATRVGGIPELIRSDTPAHLVDPGDRAAISDALVAALKTSRIHQVPPPWSLPYRATAMVEAYLSLYARSVQSRD